MCISKTMATGFALLWAIGAILIHPIFLIIAIIILVDVLER
jgi:hypothetical protein